MRDELPGESELEDMIKDVLDKYKDCYGVSVGVEDNGFEVHITYEESTLPSIGEPLDRIRNSIEDNEGYLLRADFRPEDKIYEISVETPEE